VGGHRRRLDVAEAGSDGAAPQSAAHVVLLEAHPDARVRDLRVSGTTGTYIVDGLDSQETALKARPGARRSR
jgi:hypothetical protein